MKIILYSMKIRCISDHVFVDIHPVRTKVLLLSSDHYVRAGVEEMLRKVRWLTDDDDHYIKFYKNHGTYTIIFPVNNAWCRPLNSIRSTDNASRYSGQPHTTDRPALHK